MQRNIYLLFLGLLLASSGILPGSGTLTYPLDLPNYGPAPELNNEVWINVDHPLRLTELQGQVVLLEMWTFG